jgi:hypothetical protein
MADRRQNGAQNGVLLLEIPIEKLDGGCLIKRRARDKVIGVKARENNVNCPGWGTFEHERGIKPGLTLGKMDCLVPSLWTGGFQRL